MGWSIVPPEPRTRLSNHPTLLFSWWCTCFSLVIILIRLAGRKIRTNVLFREDKIMALALIPLFIRMGLVHPILLYGTNNVNTITLNPEQIREREIGSRLVLASRIFYALFIWTSKFTVSEFLKRITSTFWNSTYEYLLHCIRIFLLVTYFAVFVATLAECQPISNYWQVVPDPGPRCRQGYAQLLTMGIADIMTDILLIILPIPIILRSAFTLKRKFDLTILFSLSAILIAITVLRVIKVIDHKGLQQYRTLWASCEILASTAVANIISIGSFIRDRGLKKNKYRPNSISDSIERAPTLRPQRPMPKTNNSTEDLFRINGWRMPDELKYEEVEEDSPITRPAPTFSPLDADTDTALSPDGSAYSGSDTEGGQRLNCWARIPPLEVVEEREDTRNLAAFFRNNAREDGYISPRHSFTDPEPCKLQLSDVGGLLGEDVRPSARSPAGGGAPLPISSRHPSPMSPLHRGSRNLLTDLGGLLPTSPIRSPSLRRNRFASQNRRSTHEDQPAAATTIGATSRPIATSGAVAADFMDLQDIGGLLK